VTAESATLSILVAEDPNGGPPPVSLVGTGTIPESVSPKALSFGNVVRTASKTMIVTLNNKAFANGGSLTLTGASTTTADFQVTPGGTCPLLNGTLSDASCTYAVTFTPSSDTLETDTLSIGVMEDLGGGPPPVSLIGTGTIPEALSTKALNFGNVVQTASRTMIVTLNNKAFASGGSLTLTGASTATADFQVTPGGTCPLPNGTLSAASCTYAVMFTPSSETLETDTLSIGVSGDPPLSVSLSGTGLTPLKVTPASLAFPTVKGGKTSLPKTVTVTNLGGAALSLSASVSGTNSGDFTVTGAGTCGPTLAGGGASCTYTMTFTPSIVGAEGATLAVSAGVTDAASPHNVNLSGTGS
jgi:hypothetical protein